MNFMECIKYNSVINPRKLFSGEYEVRNFVMLTKDINALEALKKACEDEELYEYCSIFKARIEWLTQYK